MTPPHSLSAHLFAYDSLKFEHLRAAAEAGFARVELWAMTPHFDAADPAAVARLGGWLRDLALEPASFHAPFYADLEEARAGRWLSLADPDPRRRREAAARTAEAMRALGGLGARIAVLHPGAPAPAGEREGFEPLRGSVEDLLPLAERLGLTLALENISAPNGRAEPLAAFVESLAHPRLRACLDAGHAHLTERDRAGEAFRRLAPLAASAHIHDNDGRTDAHLVPGGGSLPWTALGEALEAAGFAGPLTFEIKRREGESYADTLAALARAAGALFAGSTSGEKA